MSGDPAGEVLGLDTGRRGEFAQVERLGRALGRPFRSLRLDARGGLPAGAAVGPRPALMLAFGRGAGTALELAGRWAPPPPVVQLGTPGHHPTRRFALVLPMPQDDYPAAPNVRPLVLPLNGAVSGRDHLPNRAGGVAGTVLVLGGQSRHMRLGPAELVRMLSFGARLAAANREVLRVVGSPRSGDAGTIAAAARTVGAIAEPADAYPALLEAGARFVVSADSASMLAETCRSGAPVWLFPLPFRPDPMRLLQEGCDLVRGGRELRHALVRRGRLGGGTDFRRWHRRLERDGVLRRAGSGLDEAALRWQPPAGRPDLDLRDCRERVLRLLRAPLSFPAALPLDPGEG